MTALDIIRRASLAGIDLNIRDGQLFARLPESAPPDLVAAIRDHKPAIVAALASWPVPDGIEPVAAADLTGAERIEAETLAADLTASGGLGQFAGDLVHTWHDLSARDRLAAVYVVQLACRESIAKRGAP